MYKFKHKIINVLSTLQYVLSRALVALVFVGLLLGYFYTHNSSNKVFAATSSFLNFQSRLQNISGSTVPDGNYNVEFKLYTAPSAGTLLWTESRLNTNTQGVRLVNGYLSVNLGSVTAFPAINWDQDLYLTMNVGSTNVSCTPFTSCTPDGELNPRIKLTAVPYAFQAGQAVKLQSLVGGNTGTLSFSTVANNPVITIPDVASGTLCLQGASACGFVTGSGTAFLQGGNTLAGTTDGDLGTNNNGNLNFRTNNTTKLTVSTAGDLSFAPGANRTLSISQAASGAGNDLSIVAGQSNTGVVNGGNLFLQAGATGGTGTTGSVIVRANGTNSTTAFQVQSSGAAQTLLSANTVIRAAGTAGNLVVIGDSTGTDIDTTILKVDSATADPTTNLASLNGGLFYNSTTNKTKIIENGVVKTLCNTTDLGCGTGGGTTLQGAYTASTGGTTPEIKLDGTRLGLDIQDADTTTGASLFNIRASNGAGLGSQLLAVGNTGVTTLKNSVDSTAAFQVQNAAGISIFNVDTTNAKIGTPNTSTASTNSQVLSIKSGDASGTTSNSGNVVIDSGTATGTVGSISVGTGAYAHNTTIGNTTGSSTLTLQAGTGNIVSNGNLIASGASTATTGTTEAVARTNVTTVTLTAAGSFANNDVIFINNAGQKYYTRITAGGGTTTLTVSPAVSYSASVSVTKYTVQNIGATSTDYTTLNNRFFQGYFLGGVVTGAGSTTLSDGNLSSTGALNFGTSGSTKLTISTAGDLFFAQGGNRTLSVAQATSGAGNSLTIAGGAAQTGSSLNGGDLLLQGGTVSGTGTSGSVIVKNSIDSTTTFQIQNSAGTTLLTANTAGMNLVVGGDIYSKTASLGSSGAFSLSIDTVSGGAATAVLVPADGLPVVAYTNSTSLYSGTDVAKCISSSCSASTKRNTFVANGKYVSTAIGTNGFLTISSYRDTFGEYDLSVLTCADSRCTTYNTVVSPDTTGDVGQYTSTVIGSDGFPVISYYDVTNGDLKILKCGNAGCTTGNTITAVDTTGNVGQFTSIKLGTDNLPVVSYYDVTNANLKVIKCGNASCSAGNTTTTLDSTGDVGQYTSIAVPSTNLPVVSYYDVTNGSLKILKCGNASCSAGNTTTIADAGSNPPCVGFVCTTDNRGSHSSISIGSDGFPIVSYNHSDSNSDSQYNSGGNNQYLRVLDCSNATCAGGTTITDLDTASSSYCDGCFTQPAANSVGSYTSITVPSDGKPVISYYYDAEIAVGVPGRYIKVIKCTNTTCSTPTITTLGGGLSIGSETANFNSAYINSIRTPDANTPLSFITNGLERLSISGTGQALFKSDNSTAAFQIQNAAGTSIFNVDSTNQRVGIGTASPAALLSVGTSSQFQVSSTGSVLAQTSSNSATAFQIQSASAAQTLLSANTVIRAAGTAGNLVVIGDSTGTDIDTTILKVDSATADPTTNLASLNGGLFYNSTTNKTKIIENGVVKTLCNTTDLGCGSGGGSTLQAGYTASTGGTIPEIKLDSTRLGLDIQDADTTTGANLLNIRASNGSGLGSTLLSVGNTGAAIFKNSINSTTALQVQNALGQNAFSISTSGQSITINSQLDLSSSGISFNSSNSQFFSIYGGTGCGDCSGGGIALIGGDGVDLSSVGVSGGNVTLRGGYGSCGGCEGNVILAYNGTNPIGSVGIGVAYPSAQLHVGSVVTGKALFRVSDLTATAADVLNIADEGATTFKNRTNSTTAFQVQNAAGTSIFNVDSTNQRVGIGTASPAALLSVGTSSQFQVSSTGSVLAQTSSNSATAFQIQSASAAQTLLSANTVIRAAGTAGNLVVIGDSTGTDLSTTILKVDSATADPTTNLASLNGGLFYNSTANKLKIIENGIIKTLCNTTDLGCGTGGGTTLQGAYTASTGGTTPEILLDTTRNGLDIQDANTTIGTTTSLLAVRASATATSLGTALFSVRGDGNVGIGTASPSYTLHVVGPNATGNGVSALQTLQVTGGNGSAGTNTSTVGGTGSLISLTSGNGGNGFNEALAPSYGGIGGGLTLTSGTGGTGGNSTSACSGSCPGGDGGIGGTLTLAGAAGGTGGTANGSAENGGNGGRGGNISLQGGAGGLGGFGFLGAPGVDGSRGNILIQNSGGNVGIGSANTTPTRTLDVIGSWGGNQYSRTTDTTNSNTTYTDSISNGYLVYYLSSNKTATNSAATATYNLTGLPAVNGTFAFITVKASHNASIGASAQQCAAVQINGTAVTNATAVCDTAGNTASSVFESFTVARVNGTWMAIGAKATGASLSQADLAEWIKFTGQKPEAGELLTIGNSSVTVKRSSIAYDSRLIGVVTTAPHTILGEQTPDAVAVALAGRVPVKIASDSEPIQPGDYLTSSSQPGRATKAIRAGQMIGKALEAWTPGNNQDSIIAFVTTSYADPVDHSILQANNGSYDTLVVTGETKTGSLRVADTITTKDLTLTGTASINNLIVVNDITTKSLAVTGTASIEKLIVKDIEVSGSIIVNGGITTAIAQKKASYTAVLSDSIITADSSAGNFTVTLPTAIGIAGRQFTVKKTDTSSNPVTVNTAGVLAPDGLTNVPQTIDGAITYALPSPYKYIIVVSDGTNWIIVGNN